MTDRIGAGDAFMAGLIYSIRQGQTPQQIVDLATACGAVKHTIAGDCNIGSNATEVGLAENMFLAIGNCDYPIKKGKYRRNKESNHYPMKKGNMGNPAISMVKI